jgi:hypothetical protein
MSTLFRHLAEQKFSIVPSFLMYIIPVAGGNGLPQKEHLFVLGNIQQLPDLLGFAFSLSECQDVANPDRAFYVPSYDSAFVFPFHEPHSYLYHFARDASSPYYLRHFSRNGFFS